MQQLVHIIASAAAMAALCLGLWQNWGLGVTLKKALISYMAVFATCAVMVLSIRIIPYLDRKSHRGEPARGGRRADS